MVVETTPAIAGAAACLPAQPSHHCSSLTLSRPGGGRPRIAGIQRVAVTAPLLNRATRTLLARGPPSQPNAFRRSSPAFSSHSPPRPPRAGHRPPPEAPRPRGPPRALRGSRPPRRRVHQWFGLNYSPRGYRSRLVHPRRLRQLGSRRTRRQYESWSQGILDRSKSKPRGNYQRLRGQSSALHE